jgi:hypothetical protein
MNTAADKLAKSLHDALTKSNNRKPSPYDTRAVVVRVEGDVAWVKIPGGVDETPVQKTMNAAAGDRVQIRVSNGRAWLVGNSTNPPTDDTVANEANSTAKSAKKDVVVVKAVADSAQTTATAAGVTADAAKEIADNTYIYDHEYVMNAAGTIAHFTAHVYRGGVEVTDLFSDENFTWFYKTEEGEFPVATPNTGKEIDVAISDMSYGGHIIGYFNNDENDATLQTANYRALETYNNKKLLARASTDEVRVRDLSKTTVISVSDEILVVNSADEKLASVSNLADAVWSKYAITIEGEPLNQGNNVYEDLGLLSITNSELENIIVL